MDRRRENHIAKLLQDIEKDKTAASEEQGQTCSGDTVSEAGDPIKRYYSKALTKNSAIDSQIKEELNNKRVRNKRYQDMQKFRKKLPTYKMQEVRLFVI